MEKKPINNKLIIKIDHLCTLDPLTVQQGNVFACWHKRPVHVLYGTAGTGKTFISVYKGLEDVLDRGNHYEKLVLLRSAVSARDIGALPGSLEEKAMVYEMPYYEICSALFSNNQAYMRLKEQGKIQFALTSFIRGITFDNSVVIVDEIQNCTYQELYSIMTRVGENSYIVFCGDFKQTDIRDSGLHKFLAVLRRMGSVGFYEFTADDIVRSALVKEFIIAEEMNNEKS